MDITKSILQDIRSGVGLSEDTADFDKELLMHINNAIGVLNQNGVGKHIVVSGVTTTWADLQDPLDVEGNEFFGMVPLFITLSTKVLFDPPPPSTVDQYAKTIDQTLWRLKIGYEGTFTTTTTTIQY